MSDQRLKEEKISLRRFYLAKRRELTDGVCETQSAEICRLFCEWLRTHQPQTSRIALFAPLAQEPNLLPLLTALGAKFRWALPRILDKTQKKMDFAEITAVHELRMGSLGFSEPPLEHMPVSFEKNDLMLVPALALGMNGARLGFGQGYYDRFLAALSERPRTMGVGFSAFLAPTLPTDHHDIPMDYILSDLGITACQ